MGKHSKKYLSFFTLTVLFFSCKTNERITPPVVEVDTTKTEITSHSQLKENIGKSVFVIGKIVREEFVDKGGRGRGIYETLIELDSNERIHIRNIGEEKVDYSSLTNKKVKLEATVFYGGIDSDNPEQQSRIGYRIDFKKLIILE